MKSKRCAAIRGHHIQLTITYELTSLAWQLVSGWRDSLLSTGLLP